MHPFGPKIFLLSLNAEIIKTCLHALDLGIRTKCCNHNGRNVFPFPGGPQAFCCHSCVGTGQAPRPKLDASKRSEEHTSELQSRGQLVCRLLLEKNNKKNLRTNSSSTTT